MMNRFISARWTPSLTWKLNPPRADSSRELDETQMRLRLKMSCCENSRIFTSGLSLRAKCPPLGGSTLNIKSSGAVSLSAYFKSDGVISVTLFCQTTNTTLFTKTGFRSFTGFIKIVNVTLSDLEWKVSDLFGIAWSTHVSRKIKYQKVGLADFLTVASSFFVYLRIFWSMRKFARGWTPTPKLKMDFRSSVPGELFRDWCHFKWFSKLYSLRFSDSSF